MSETVSLDQFLLKQPSGLVKNWPISPPSMPAHFLARAHRRTDSSSDDAGGNHSNSDVPLLLVHKARLISRTKCTLKAFFFFKAKLFDADCSTDLVDRGLIKAN